jgi:hypothetical protein
MRLPRCFPIIPCLIAGLTLSDRNAAAQIPADQFEFFENRIRPVLAQECYECHRSGGKEKGGLALDHRAGWQRGGESGAVLVPGDPATSRLMRAIRHESPDLKMPKAGAKLDEAIVADFAKWIAMGAPDPRDAPPTEEQLAADTDWNAVRERRKSWWSFQPIQRSRVPKIAGAAHPVDAFIREKLAAAGLQPSPPADPRSLVRRLHFSLVGLPPSLEETASFLAGWERDPQAATVARVDALIASSSFGEKWARHWMDWVRYTDSHGSEGDPEIPHAWRYRDNLIRALNGDVPYDQLVREHFAGDLLEKPRVNEMLKLNESALGLGHLRMVFHGFAPTDALDERVRFTDDQIATATKAFLGLTVACARCHNHKFDAISQADYYALYGIFTAPLPATIAVDAPGVLERNRDELSLLKAGDILPQLADYWMGSLRGDRDELLKRLEPAKDEKHPLHLLWKLSRGEKDPSAAAPAPVPQRDLFVLESFTTDWSRYGEGMIGLSRKAGDFTLATEGPRAVKEILPAGFFSHRVSSKHRTVLASAPVDLDGDYELFLHVAGEGSSVRYAVQHYPRSGTVYPVTPLNGGEWRWQRYDLSYWKGDRIHIELATAGDAPILVKDSVRSWFGIRDALLVKKGDPAPVNAPGAYLAPVIAKDGDIRAALVEALARMAGSYRAHQRGERFQLNDEEVQFLNAALQGGLLPNDLAQMPAPLRELIERYRALEAEIPTPTRAPGVFERPGRNEALMVRGNHKQPGEIVPRRFLEAIDATPYTGTGSGRLEFARDLLREDNPFTARVIVNRVWHHLFGEGIVPTPDNFGRLGEKPSHPELLDFLADRFRGDQQWSMKALIRDLVLSETWRQAAAPSPEALERDPSNRLLSHHSTRRLEAEAIRDAFLSVSGSLSEERFGPPADGGSNRRSIYLRTKRNSLDPLLTTFDFPTPASAVGRRDSTNVPAQSLTLLNDPFIAGQAAAVANRLRELPDDDARIDRLFETALTRPPTDAERTQARSFLAALEREHRDQSIRSDELTAKLGSARDALAAISDPVRARLLKKKQAARQKGKPALPPDLKPAAEWTFDRDASDSIGNLDGKLVGTARIEGGAAVLDGSGFIATSPLKIPLAEKTLEVVVQLDTTGQRGGGVMTVQDRRGGAFDSIVFAEKKPGEWLPGSNNFARTLDFGGLAEADAARTPVHLVVAYDADGTIRAYRNGLPYGGPVRKAAVHEFTAGDTQVVFGLRHGTQPDGNRSLRGRVLEARLYDRALSAEEAKAAAGGDAVFVGEAEVLAALSDAQRSEKARLEAELAILTADLAALQRAGGGELPIEQRRWRDLAHAVFNLKEFIYLR